MPPLKSDQLLTTRENASKVHHFFRGYSATTSAYVARTLASMFLKDDDQAGSN